MQALAIAREIGDRYSESLALVNLADTNTQLGQIKEACEQYQEAVNIAQETQDNQNLHEANYGLALARLLKGELTAAGQAIDTAQTHDFPTNTAAMWTLKGIIRLRQEQCDSAREAFSRGLAEANKLLEKSDRIPAALDTKALALCGLALCEGERHLDVASAFFRAARNISKAKGVVIALLNQFDALAQADQQDILMPLRKVAEGG